MSLRLLKTLALLLVVGSAQAALAKDCRLTVYFGLDRADLTPDMEQVLLMFMVHNPNANGSVIGHTDALASQEYNVKLSMRRALTVVNFIEQYNANSVSLATDWRGKMDLVVNTPNAEVLNRRVEIYYHNCTPVTRLAPLPTELRDYQTIPTDTTHHENNEQDHSGSSSSASAGSGGTTATSSGSGNAAAASAGNGSSSASSAGSSGAASASAGPSGSSASSAGPDGASAASAGNGSTSVSSSGG